MESSGNKSRDRDRDRDRERDKERERERERDRDRDRDRDRMKVRGAGILTGNEIEKGMRGTEPRTEVIVQRIEQKIQGAFGEIKTSVVPRYAYSRIVHIATITIPPTLHGKRIAIDIILTLQLIIKPQAVMATGQVLFHHFYFAASCLWLASKLEECPKKARQVIIVFHRMECRRGTYPLSLWIHIQRNHGGDKDPNQALLLLALEFGIQNITVKSLIHPNPVHFTMKKFTITRKQKSSWNWSPNVAMVSLQDEQKELSMLVYVSVAFLIVHIVKTSLAMNLYADITSNVVKFALLGLLWLHVTTKA
ncbi:unnamed protein product [Prunus armeniaca]